MFFKTFQIWLIIQLKLFPHTPYTIGFQHGEHFARNWLLMSENEREEYYNNLHSLYLVLQNEEENPQTTPVDLFPSPFSSTNSLMSTVSNISWENEDFEI